MKDTHTHRGHCQLCTQVQALDVNTGFVAKHGYTVDGGYFNGVCPGSDRPNLHVDRKLADASIKQARDEARRLDVVIAAYKAGTDHPAQVWNGTYVKEERTRRDTFNGGFKKIMVDVEVMVNFADAHPLYQKRGVERVVASMDSRANACRSYATDLEVWANRITGKVDAYQLKDLEPRDWEVGDTVRIGGKAGWDATIEAIEMRPYTTFGFRTGRGTVQAKHARLTRPAVTEKRVSEKAGGYVSREARPAAVVWEALRSIKGRAKSAVMIELEKAGKL